MPQDELKESHAEKADRAISPRGSNPASSQWKRFPTMPHMPKTFRPSYLPSRQEQQRQHDSRRDQTEQRAWYKTARWQKLKQRVHVRDLFRCQETGVLCSGKYPADDSPVADHIVEPDGDPALFWDENNIRTVSKAYHDGERQREQIAERGRGVGRKSRAPTR